MLWNGSEISEEDIVEQRKFVYDSEEYLCILYQGSVEYCSFRTSCTILPCLIDELKPVFGLRKIGTHWIKNRGKNVILLKSHLINGIVQQEVTLNQIKFSEKIALEVRRIFVFREMLGLSQNWEKWIVLRESSNFVHPVSYHESTLDPGSESKVVPQTVLDKWFGDYTLDQGVKDFFQVENLESINKLVHELRSKMEPIVERIDKDSISRVDEILRRIRLRLQFILS